MCVYLQREIQTLAAMLNITFPVRTGNAAMLLGKLLGTTISTNTFKRRKSLYNRFLTDNNVIEVPPLGKRLSLEQIESLYNFLITYREADTKDGRELERGDVLEQFGIPNTTFSDYIRYASEDSVRLGLIKANSDPKRLIYTQQEAVLMKRLWDESDTAGFQHFHDWPTTEFIRNFPDSDVSNLPCCAEGYLSYEALPTDFNQDMGHFPVDVMEVATFHLRLFLTSDFDDSDIEIDQGWVMRIYTDIESDGRKYRGDYYFIYDSSQPRGEIKGKLTFRDGCLLFDGSYREKGTSTENWRKMYFRVLPQQADMPIAREIPKPSQDADG